MSAEVVPVSPADHEALAGFLAYFPGLQSQPQFWKNRFSLWWQENPAFKGTPAGWILRRDGQIQGFLGNLPSLFQLGGRALTVYSITSWMVLPEARQESLSLLMALMAASEGSLLFDTTPTPEVAEVLESMGFAPLPWAGDRESFVVLDWKRALAAARLPALAARAFKPLQDLRLRALPMNGVLEATETAQIGPEFDQLWARTQGLYRNTNVRTAQAMGWHCQGDPDIEKRLFVCRAKGRLAGFMAFKARLRRGGLKTWDCADFWEDPTVPGVLESLIGASVREGKERGLDLISFPHFTKVLGKRLGRAGLFERASGRRALVLGSPEVLSSLKPENSYLVGLQGDYGTAA